MCDQKRKCLFYLFIYFLEYCTHKWLKICISWRVNWAILMCRSCHWAFFSTGLLHRCVVSFEHAYNAFFVCVWLNHTKLFHHHFTMTVMKRLSTGRFLWLKKQLSKHNIVALNHAADDSNWQHCVYSLLQDPLDFFTKQHLVNTHVCCRFVS